MGGLEFKLPLPSAASEVRMILFDTSESGMQLGTLFKIFYSSPNLDGTLVPTDSAASSSETEMRNEEDAASTECGNEDSDSGSTT